MSRLSRHRWLLGCLESREAPAVLIVTNNLDGPVTGADQLPGSLRQAIFDANADSSPDTITINDLGAPIVLTAGALKIHSKNIVINGPGSTLQTINGNGSSRIFEITDKSQASNAIVNISGLTLTNGKVTGTNSGGGIWAANENLTLTDVVITNCQANFTGTFNTPYGGGGIYISGVGAKLTLNTCTISGNTVAASSAYPFLYGGGIYFYGATISATNSTFTNNSCTGGPNSPDGAAGGGISVIGDSINSSATFVSCNISSNTAIRGGGLSIYNRTSGGKGMAVTLDSCILTGNKAQGASEGSFGGGGAYLYDIGKLTITNCTITGNQIIGQANGTDYAQGAGLRIHLDSDGNATPGKFGVTVSNTIISNNISSGGGGGVALSQSVVTPDAPILFQGCTVENNQANGKSKGILGGGLSFARYGLNITILNSQINNNFAYEGAGGIMLQGDADTVTMSYIPSSLTVRNSTVAYNSTGNPAAGRGGGIGVFNFDKTNANTVIIQNSTIAFNKSAFTSGTPNVSAGGLYVSAGTVSLGAAVKIESSIFQGNTFKNGTTLSDIFGPAKGIDVSNSLISVTNSPSAIVFSSDVANIKGLLASPADAKIDTMLAFNGATTTKTLALQPDSPCINTGSNTTGLLTDQRGPGFVRNANGGVDMGAFEIQSLAPPPQVTAIMINNGASQRSMVQSIKISFTEAVTFPDGLAAAFDVARYDKGSAGSVSLTFNQVGSDVTISFASGGTVNVDPGNSLQDGKYRLTINANKVQGAGGFLDGNKNMIYDGVPTDNVVENFHRLFGDNNGDGQVTAIDFNAFRLAYNDGPSIFDFNADGNTTAIDFNEFRLRYGLTGFA
jgi:hypothetical protein